MQKPEANILFNQVNVIGRLCNTPQKQFTSRKKLFTRFLVKSRYKNQAFIPFIMFGKDVDIVCTKFQQGDVVAVTAQISTRENKQGKLMIDFIVDEVRLVTKSKVQFPTEDKFKTIVALYDKDVVEGRLMKDKE